MKHLLTSIRPGQQVKNLLVFFGLFFSGRFIDPSNFLRSFLAFLSFVAMSSAVYLFNDIKDRESDRNHPWKKKRPVVSGALSVNTTAFCLVILSIISLYIGYSVNFLVLAQVSLYLLINVLYSLVLKYLVIIGVFCIGSGFVLRVLAGVYAIDAVPTIWLVACIFFASLFIGFAKRKGELSIYGKEAQLQRKTLGLYTFWFLNLMIFVNAALATGTYILFMIVLAGRHSSVLLTIPFILFAVYRYIYLTFRSKRADTPEILMADKALVINNVIWFVLFVLTKFDYIRLPVLYTM